MSCLPQREEISKADLDRWTDNLEHVMNSPRAKRKFQEFLASKNLDEAHETLHFWEQCTCILEKIKHRNNDLTRYREYRNDVKKCISLAESHANLDSSQIIHLKKILIEQNVKDVITTLDQARSTVLNNLKDEYEVFRRNLLKYKK